MALHFLDTSVCVTLLRGHASLRQLPMLRDECVLSSITVAELLFGAQKSIQPELQRRNVQDLIELFAQLPFEQNAAEHYGEIRAHLEKRGTPIGSLDQLIAAHARSLGAALITANLREFQRVPGLKCVPWKM